jgi:hypothetical protein
MSQCNATYFDGGAAVSCQNYEGHEGPHADVLGHWGIRVPLYERRDNIIRAARVLLHELDESNWGDEGNDRVVNAKEHLRAALAGQHKSDPTERQGADK